MFLNFVNSECVCTAVLLATHGSDAILAIGRDAIDQFGQLFTGGCFEDGCAVLQQIVNESGLTTLYDFRCLSCFLAHRRFGF